MNRVFAFAVVSLVACAALPAALPAHAAWRETDEAIKSRGDVTVQVLIARAVAGRDALPAPPTDIAIFFPGANGKARSARAGFSEHGPNPATMGLMAENFGMGVAVGVPSDQPDGISIAWRMGSEHIGDAGAVIDTIAQRFPKARITLIGLSAGGFSVTRVAEALVKRGTPKLHGVVVMSTAPEALSDEIMKPIRDAKVPVLVLHHKRDSCLALRDIEARAKQYDFVVIDDARQPQVSAPKRDCNPGSAHVFAGKERIVYSTIADWVRTGKTTAD